MAITDEIAKLAPVAEKNTSWVQDLINKRFQPQTERIKRNPIGFNFTREPFDPSSYYNALGTFRDVSRAATEVVKQEVYNKEEADRQREYEASLAAMRNAGGGIDPRFTYDEHDHGDSATYNGKSRKYGLKRVSPNTSKAADYFGSKYGIKNIGGWREHGSVPGSDHPKGRGLDYMINNIKNGMKVGTALANDLVQNAKAWNVKYVIWNRYIWTPSGGWHKYNGPSPHTDHVHASFKK